jgi:hypothetical protein
MNWEVKATVTIHVPDCDNGKEAIERVQLCLPKARIPSIKAMRIEKLSEFSFLRTDSVDK